MTVRKSMPAFIALLVATTALAESAGGRVRSWLSASQRRVAALPTTTRPTTQPGAPTTAPASPLTLDEVLKSVDRHYPLLFAIVQERAIAAGQVLSAEGSYDLKVGGKYKRNDNGFYQYENIDTYVEQLTPFYGASFFAGWRRGRGYYPTYYGDRETYGGGELRGGVNLPLLRDGWIDPARAKLRTTRIEREAAEPVILKQRIEFIRGATVTYWGWLASGRKLGIASDLLQLAAQRDEQVAARIRAGAIPEIEQLDNQRLVADRTAKLIASERRYQAATIDLSLYYRDGEGQPLFPDTARLPEAFPSPRPLSEARLETDVEFALQRNPEVRKLRLSREKADVELQLARNQIAPNLDLQLSVSQDVGNPIEKKDKDRADIEASVVFAAPLQARSARGRAQSLSAVISQLRAQEQYASEKVVNEVTDAYSAVQNAYLVVEQFRRSVELNRALEEAERRKFDLGQSNLFTVNLRELATADARALEVDAVAEYFRAVADYRAALAIDPFGYGE